MRHTKKAPKPPREARKSRAKPCACPEPDEGGSAISFAQQRQILAALENEKYRKFFWFCCCTGMRVCEALSVKVKNIDFKKRMIRIDMPDTRTKKHRREVPFLPRLFDEKPRGKYLFADITDEGSQHYFCRLYKSMELALTRHSTRHTFVSVCRHLSIPAETVQAWAGHTDLKMTTDTYTHPLETGSSPVLDYLKELKKSLKL